MPPKSPATPGGPNAFALDYAGFKGLYTSLPAHSIPRQYLQVCRNALPTHAGTLRALLKSSTLVSFADGDTVDGYFYATKKDASSVLIAVVNGNLQRWTGTGWTIVHNGSGIGTTGHEWNFEQFLFRVYGCNGYDPPIVYDVESDMVGFGTSSQLGLPGPVTSIALIPPGTTSSSWTLSGTGTVTGEDTVYLKGTPTNPASAVLTYDAARNFTIFPNGINVSTEYDWLTLALRWDNLQDISSFTVKFITSTGNYFYYTIDSTTIDDEFNPDDLSIGRTTWHKRLILFETYGNPSWSSITKFELDFTPTASGGTLTVEAPVIEASPPIMIDLRKEIEQFDNVGAWTKSNCDVAAATNSAYLQSNMGCTVTPKANGAYITKTGTSGVDLSVWDDSVKTPVDAKEEIKFWIYLKKKNGSPTLSSITLDLGTNSSNYYRYQWTSSLPATARVGKWLSAPMASFSATGSPDWADIRYIKITFAGTLDSNNNWEIIFDELVMGESNNVKAIAAVDINESWSTTGSVSVKKQRTTGAVALVFRPKKNASASATRSFSTYLDLSKWDNGSDVKDTDKITFAVTTPAGQKKNNWGSLTVSFTSATKGSVSKTLTGVDITTLNPIGKGGYVDIPLSDFGEKWDGWGDISSVTVSVTAQTSIDSETPITVTVDDIKLIRNNRGSEARLWRYLFRSGIQRSFASNPSVSYEQGRVNEVAKGFTGKVRLLNIKSIPGQNLSVDIYRLSPSGDYLFETSIANGQTSVVVNDVPESKLGNKLPPETEGEGAADTTALPIFKRMMAVGNRMHGWGVQQYPNYLFVSKAAQPWLFDKIDAIVYDSHVLDVVHAQPSPYVLTAKGVRPYGSTEVTVESPCSYFGSCPLPGGGFALLTWNSVYIFEGGNPRDIGKPISNYLTSTDYTITDAKLIYFDTQLFLFLPKSSGGSTVLIYDIETDAWGEWDEGPSMLVVKKGLSDGVDVLTWLDKSTATPKIKQFQGGSQILPVTIETHSELMQTYLKKQVDSIKVMVSLDAGVEISANIKYDGEIPADEKLPLRSLTHTGGTAPILLSQKTRAWSARGAHESANLSFSVLIEAAGTGGFCEIIGINVAGRILPRE